MRAHPRSILHRRRRAALVAILVACMSCTVGPDYRPPETTVPDAWGETNKDSAARDGQSAPDPDQMPIANWWTTFDDPTLERLIERAIVANPDLRRAQAHVLEARALRGITEADLYPTVDAAGSAIRSKSSETITPVFPGAGSTKNLYRAGFDAAWEIDFFGGVRRDIEAADADVAAAIEDRRDVLVSLLAEVAANYVELRGSQRRVAIARENLATQQSTVEITQIRMNAGLVSDLDVARAEAQAQTIAAQIPTFDSAVRQSIHRLSVLLAEQPNALAEELTRDESGRATKIPVVPASVPIGLPSELLRRRPDVRRAERLLAAATARIGVATADLFPRFALTGSAALESSEPHTLGDTGSFVWSLGPSFRWPVLDFGKIRSQIAAENAREEQAAAVYEQTVLTSLREVEDTLVAFTQEQQRRESLHGAVEANRRAVSLADQLYQQGSEDFLSVLQAQRDLFVTEDSLVESERTVATNMVALYKALGGGWEVEALAGSNVSRGEAGSRSFDLTQSPAAPPP